MKKSVPWMGVVTLIAACSTHGVRCRGALQPINPTVAVAGKTMPAAGKSRVGHQSREDDAAPPDDKKPELP